MGKRIILLMILVAAGLVGYFYYKHHQEEVRLASGEVTCDGCMTPEQHTKFLRENATETADSQSERRAKTPLTDDTSTSTSAGTAGTAATPAVVADRQVTPAAAALPSPTASAPVLAASAPKSDSIAPNPPNGMVFAGKGTYQWYRQGNLTWRVDTTSGRSCIIYATMEEWRKQIVLSHGCGRSA